MPTRYMYFFELNASPAASDRPAPPFHPISASRSAASSGVGQRDTAAAVASTAAAAAASQ